MVQLHDPFGLTGATLAGKYDVESVVAETEFSVVYRANHRVWRRPVAIKAFKAASVSESARERLLESFVREGALMMELSERSATICQARDVGSTITTRGDWVPYMILEWLEGEALDVVLAREREAGRPRRTVAEAMRLLGPVAEALALAHDRHIVHGDVKPGNVFLVADATATRCKLLDFGIAKVLDRAAGDETIEGAPGRSFTPAYAAPEQFSAALGPTGPWTDVFALALLFVELVTGCEPLAGTTVEELSATALDDTTRPTPRTLGAAVDDAVEDVIARAVAVRPEDRYVDVRYFWAALVAAASPTRATLDSEDRSSLAPPASERGGTIPIRLTRKRPVPRRRWVVPGIAFVGAATSLLAMQHYAAWLPAARAEAWSRLQSWPAVVVTRAISSAHLHPSSAP